MTQMPAGQAVIEALRAEGVEHIFGLVGHTINSIVTELYDRTDITFVDTRHEEGAAFMAYGYARASGKPVACVTTSGPAATNTLTGVALAWKGHAPVIVITGNTPVDTTYRDGSQAFDLVNIFKPVTKLALQIHKTQNIPDLFQYAFRHALSGKQGPVFVDIPQDLLDRQEVSGEISLPSTYRAVQTRISGDSSAISQATNLLINAERPLLLAGGGIIDSEATEETIQIAELLDMAIVPTYAHHDVVPNSHRLYVGPPGGRGSVEGLKAINSADVILALGSRLNQATTGWNYDVINPNTKIIQVDIDPLEIGRNYPVDAGIVGDAKAVAQQLLQALREQFPEGKPNPQWKAKIEELASTRIARLEQESNLPLSNPMRPELVYPELRKVLPRNCMVSIDAGVTAGLAYDRLFFEEPRTMFNYAQQGGLGMGFCVGLGTKLGRPDRPAISISGDGGFLYSSQELNTAVRWNIPLVSIVLNNNCQGAEKSIQQRSYDARYIGVDLMNPRFDKLAEVHGARGFYVDHPKEIGEAISEALALNIPSVVEIPVSQDFPTAARLTT
mgnify:CR=1 FL=1